MAVIDHIDGSNRDIYLSAETVGASVHPIDIYKEMRTLRKNDEDLRKYDVFLSAFGNVPKGGGKFTERYVRENLGTRIIPYDTSHTLTITGTIITDDGQEGIDCFDRAPLTSTTIVDINYIPPQVEVIQVSSGSGLSTLEHDKLMTGLDVSIPDKVWDEQQSEHIIVGSYGKELLTEIENAKTLIESQRGSHTWAGNMFYVDPINGASYSSGARGSKTDPLLSIQDCHDNLVTDSNHDVIILLPGSPSGATILDERITLSKRYLFIRGPGRDFILHPTTEGDTIKVRADGIELSGFQITTHNTGNGNAVDILGCDFVKVHEVWFNWSQNDGLKLKNTSHAIIENNTFYEAGQGTESNAIQITANSSSKHNKIANNFISNILGYGVNISGGALTSHTLVIGNSIGNCTRDGINIQANVESTFVAGNSLGNITQKNIDDHGNNSAIKNNEQWGTVDGIWDEQISEHLDTGTTGAQLATASSGGVDYDTLAEAVWDRNLSLHTTNGSAGQLVKETSDIENGDWELANNQMIFKDKLGTELFRVNLFDEGGNPSTEEVYKRVRV